MSEARKDWYWIRRDVEGRVTGALVERAFSSFDLMGELAEMASIGPIERVYASPVVIGEALKEILIRKVAP